jgi:hypothetical protein
MASSGIAIITFFLYMVCVLANKISTYDALCKDFLCVLSARRMEWRYGARDLRWARFWAKTNIEKLSIVCFLENVFRCCYLIM